MVLALILMKHFLTISIEMLVAIANNDNPENQRAHFLILNENIVLIAMNIENLASYYVQKCPMANDNKGELWLSTEEDIIHIEAMQC